MHTTPNPLSVNSIHLNALSDAARYELWHQRLAHCGTWAMENAHKHVIGVPKLRGNLFYKCASCMHGKLCTKRSNVKHNRNLGTVLYASTDGTVHKSPGRPPMQLLICVILPISILLMMEA